MAKISNAEIKHMAMAYAIQMWHKRKALGIEDPVPVYVAHIRARFPTPLWRKRIQSNFQDLASSHPHFNIVEGVLLYYPQQ